MRHRMLLLGAAVLTACATTESPDRRAAREQAEADSARTAILAGSDAFVRFTNAGQTDSVAMLYAENGRIMPPNMATSVGRDSIRATFTAMGGGQLTVDNREITSHGPLAVERGTYTYTMAAAAGRPAINDRGKYMNHLHLVNGRWLVVDGIWNSDMPPMPAPPARR